MLPTEGCYAERVVWFVFGLAFLCSHSMAQVNGTGDILIYKVTEEVPPGTFVGNLALDAGLYRAVDLTQTTFTIVSNIPNITNTFVFESSGILKTKTVINRDVICPQQSVCQMLFSVIVQSKDYFRVFKVLVNIEDINDCSPTFSPSQLNLTVSESSAVGELIPLPTATDLDSPANGVESYALQPDQDPFRLQIHNISGLLDIRLNLTSMLDREQQSSYTLTLVAYDGGLPPRSGSLVLEITVADVNDNNPVFDNSTYEVHVPENTSVGSMIVAVHASDRDAGQNGRIKYKFSQRSQNLYGRTFFLEPDSGNVILLQTLNAAERSSYNLAILAVDQGSVPLSGSAALLIVVQQVMDRPPVINVDVLSDDGLANIPETSPTGTFVAHVSVDAQGGQTTVSCTLNDTDNFQLVPLTVKNEFKVVTVRMFNAAATNNYVVVISCTEEGEPYLSSAKTLAVFITAGPVLSPPVFENSNYSATVIVSSPPNTVVTTVRALIPSTVTRNVTIAYAIDTTDTNKGFYVDPQTGVITTLVSFGRDLAGTEVEFYVIASYKETNNTAGQSSRARVRVRILDNGAKPPRFQQNYYSFSVLETADVGTAIGSVMATIPTADNISYHAVSLQGTSIVDLAVDESSGVISTARALMRDLNPRYEFQVVARNTRFVGLNDTARVDVYVQENRPNITYPGPGYNNTVYISPVSGLQILVATVTARLSQPDLGLCFSIRNYSEFFSIDVRSGELRLTANISQFSNHTLALIIEVIVCGHPFARSSAVLYVTVVGETGVAPQSSPATGGFDSRAVILACVLAVCFVLATVMVVAIVLVCRRSRKRSSRASSGGASFWTAVPVQARTSPERSFSRDGQHRTQMTNITLEMPPNVYKAMELEEADADSGCPSNSSSSQTSSDDGAGAGAAAGGGGGAGASRSGGTGGGGDDSKRSSNSSDNNDGGIASPVFVTPSSSHLYSSVVPNWLKSSGAALPLADQAEAPPVHSLEGASNLPDKPLVLKPSLSRSGSLASRKSIRFGPDGSAIAEAKKKVHFAEQNQYLELNSADVTASDITDLSDVSNSRSTGADDQDDVSDASSYADSETRRTVINTMANSGYANVPHYPPPGVTFGTFLPEDGSLV